MSGIDERAFVRLLRWYPRAWRRRHGDVVVATMLEAAEHDGRTTPAGVEVRQAIVHGMAARLDRPFALTTAVVAVAGAVLVGILWSAGIPGFVALVLLTGVVPAVATCAVVAVARLRGLVEDAESLGILLIGSAAWALSALASLSWSLGFDAADEGRPVVGLAAAWLPLVSAGVLVGATAIALGVASLLRRATRFPLVARAAVGAGVGLVLAPVLGMSTISPFSATVMAAAAILVAVLWSGRDPRRAAAPAITAGRRDSASAPPSPVFSTGPDRRRRSAARWSAWLATLGGAIGLAYAFTGASWSPGASDGTVAMAHGITLLLLSAIPLSAAFGLAAAAPPGARAAWHRRGPLILVALGTGSVALAYTSAPASAAMQPGLQAGAVLIGAALAWVIAIRSSVPRVAAVILGIAAGALFASFLGVMIAPMLALGVPVAALLLALRTSRRPRPVRPTRSSPRSAPVPAR